MIRDIIMECEAHRISQNLACDIWILSVKYNEKNSEICVFDRRFSGAPISDLMFVSGETHLKSLSEVSRSDGCIRVSVQGHVSGDVRVIQYKQNQTIIHVDTFNPYRLEKDYLKEDELAYLRKIVPGFEVFPNIDPWSWQCLCSYVNPDVLTCDRCGRTKHENGVLSKHQYHKEMLEDALHSVMVSGGNIDASLKAISQRFKVPLQELRKEITITSQNLDQDTPSQHKKSRLSKGRAITLVSVGVVMGLFLIGQPFIQKYIKYMEAQRYVSEQNYREARAIYLESLNFLDSGQKQIETYFEELMDCDAIAEPLKREEEIVRILYDLQLFLEETNQLPHETPFVIEIAKRYIGKLQVNQSYDIAIELVQRYLGFKDAYGIEVFNEAKQYFIQTKQYDKLVSYSYIMMLDVPTDYQEIIGYYEQYITDDFMPYIESASPSDILYRYQATDVRKSLQALVEYNMQAFLPTVYETLYRILERVGFNHEYQMQWEYSVLYSANYKDSRSRLDSYPGLLLDYSVTGSHALKEHDVQNPYYVILSQDDPQVTLKFTPIEYGKKHDEFVFTCYALGIFDKRIDVSNGSGVISLDLTKRPSPEDLSILDINIRSVDEASYIQFEVYMDET